MKAFYHLVLIYILLIFTIPLLSQKAESKKNIAVIDLESRGGLSQAEIGTLTDRLRTMLVQTNAFNVVDRGRMQNILDEQGFQMSGCTSTECAVEAGMILGVEEMVSGTLGRLGELYTIDILLIDVESSKIIRSLAKDHTGKIEGLIPVMKEIADELAGIKAEKSIAAFGNIRIETDPDGVEIFIDDQKKGTTPFTVQNLPVGKHALKLKKKGYTDYQTEINITKDQTRNISTELIKSFAFTISSKPPGADVYINGKKMGVTPLRNYYPDDTDLKIELRMENYQNWTDEVTIDRHRTLNAEMEFTDAYAKSLAKQSKEQKASVAEPVTEGGGSNTWLWIGAGAVAVGAAAFLLMPQDDGSSATAEYPIPPDRPVE